MAMDTGNTNGEKTARSDGYEALIDLLAEVVIEDSDQQRYDHGGAAILPAEGKEDSRR